MAERNASDNDIPIWILDTVTNRNRNTRELSFWPAATAVFMRAILWLRASARYYSQRRGGRPGRCRDWQPRIFEELGLAVATVAHSSGKIGDGEDMLARGVISYTNGPAAALGCAVGESAADCAAKCGPARSLPAIRRRIRKAAISSVPSARSPRLGPRLASLLLPEDKGRVVIMVRMAPSWRRINPADKQSTSR